MRTRGHVAALRTALDDHAGAKHMEFLCQEIQREINTIAAKDLIDSNQLIKENLIRKT